MDIWKVVKTGAHIGVKVAVGIGGTVLTGLLMKAADNYVDEQIDGVKGMLDKEKVDERGEERA